jgi:hypothetical protein
MNRRTLQQTNWLRIPASVDFWKVLVIFLLYSSAVALCAAFSPMALDGINMPAWITIILVALAIAMPFLVLIWGAVRASREIRRRIAECPTTPEGLILTLLANWTIAGLASLPLAITAWPLTLVCLPFVVWAYLAILQRRTIQPVEGSAQTGPSARST